MSGTYRIIEHPSDAGIEAEGETLAEAFALAAEGLMAVIVDPASVEAGESRTVAVDGPDDERLLVRWLGEILWLYDGEGFVSRRFEVEITPGGRISAAAFGEPLDAAKHALRVDVKAVTYHGLEVRRTPGGWSVRAYIDI